MAFASCMGFEHTGHSPNTVLFCRAVSARGLFVVAVAVAAMLLISPSGSSRICVMFYPVLLTKPGRYAKLAVTLKLVAGMVKSLPATCFTVFTTCRYGI